MTAPVIQLQGVTKRFGGQTVLRDLTFHVDRGEILGLLGPNGSGKTTTIRLLNGVIRPDGGEIAVGGYNPVHDGDAIRRMSGILTESAGFYLHMSALENLRFFAELYGVTDRDRPMDLLEHFGLAPYKDRKVGAYSTGMRKRLGLAKALLHRPEILFLDEPTNGLDPEGTRMVLGQIADLSRREGTTMILCSHQLQLMETVCTRYVFLDRGRLIEQGTLAELEERYRTEIRLQVETDLRPEGEMYAGFPVTRAGEGLLRFTLPSREAISDLLRQVLTEAQVYGATVLNRDLESLYFKIREVASRDAA